MEYKLFTFNAFQINTYILYDDSKQCAIIDPGCSSNFEENILKNFISSNNLTPKVLINTHAHIDHVLGNSFVSKCYNIKPTAHKAGKVLWESAKEYADYFGVEIDQTINPEIFVSENDIIKFGDTILTVLYTPGHADGSICLLNKKDKIVITGDVLFKDSIGRTDLPTGDFNTLMDSIKNKLFTLNNDFVVLPGHGNSTTIGYEKLNNPYIM